MTAAAFETISVTLEELKTKPYEKPQINTFANLHEAQAHFQAEQFRQSVVYRQALATGDGPDEVETAEIQNGVKGIDTRTFAVFVDGRRVDTAYGAEWQAWDVYHEWVKAIKEDRRVLDYMDMPIDEIPDTYWKYKPQPISL